MANLVYSPGVPLPPVKRSQALLLNPHIHTMLPADEVAALSRIRITINRYPHPTGDLQDLVNNQPLAAYLKWHLARPDWAVWQDLPTERRVSLVTDQEEQRVRHAFTRLIKQYKRVGYESGQFWQQAQTKPDVGL